MILMLDLRRGFCRRSMIQVGIFIAFLGTLFWQCIRNPDVGSLGYFNSADCWTFDVLDVLFSVAHFRKHKAGKFLLGFLLLP